MEMTVLLGTATRLRLARLLLITDLRQQQADLTDFVEEALAGGVDVVQLRDPAADASGLAGGFRSVKQASARHRALLGAYDALDVMSDSGADLLQLSERGTPPAEARRAVPEHALIGRSCHSRREVDAALADPDVDYLMIGPVLSALPFGGAGLGLVGYAAGHAPQSDPDSKPWFAVGGITAATLDDVLDDVLDAGARRIAVSSAITQASEPASAAATLKQRLVQAWNDDPGMAAVTFGAFSAHPGRGPAATNP